MTEKLNIAKRQAEIQQAQGIVPQSVAASNTSTVTGSAFTSVPKAEEDPYMKVIRGEKFQSKTPQEQFEILKKQFPNVDGKELQKILDAANTIIQKEKEGIIPQTTTVTPSEDKVSPEDNAVQAAEEQGIKNANIDDIKMLAKTLSKQDPKNLTDSQKFIIEFAQTLEDKSKSIDFIDKNADLFDNIISKEVTQTQEWKNLSPKQKLDVKLDALLEKVSPEYQKISDSANKENYRNELLKQVVEKLFQSSNETKMSDAEKEYHISIIAMASDAAESKGITMRQLIDMSRKNPEKVLNTVIDYADEKGLFSSYFSSKTNSRVSPQDSLMNIAKGVMKAANAEGFSKLSEEEQNKLAASAIVQIGKRLYGDSWKVTDSKSGKPVSDPQEILSLNSDKVRSFALRFEAAKHAGARSLNEVLNTSQKQQVAEERKYSKEVLKRNVVKPELEVEWQAREHFNKLRVNEDDKLEYLKHKEKTQGLSESEKNVKAEIEVHKQLGDEYYQKLENLGDKRQSLKDNFDGDIYQFTLDECGGDVNKLKERLKDSKYLNYLAIIANPRTKEDALIFLESLGLEKNKDAINIFKTQHAFNRISQVKINPNDKVAQKEALEGIKDLNDAGQQGYVSAAYRTVVPETKNEAFITTAYEQGLQMNYNLYKDSIAIGLNNESLKENNLGEKIAHNVLSSANVSQDAKRSLTESYIQYASDDEARISHANALSNIDNEGVVQGLIDGLKYVTTQSYQAQYDKAVTKSINSISNPAAKEKLTASYNETKSSSLDNKDSTSSTNSTSNKSANSTTASSASTQTATTSANTNTSNSPAVKISSQTKPYVIELSTQLDDIAKKFAQASYEHSLAEREKTLNSLQAIIDKIQNDQKVHAQKQAEIAKKEAKTDEEIAKAIKEAEIKSAEEQKVAQEKIAEETAELEEIKKLEKTSGIPQDTIIELKKAQANGDLSKIYSLLSVKPEAQKQFIQYLSHKDTATIIGFIRNRSTDKDLIKKLCNLNPSLIKVLDPELLKDCGILEADIIKYASPDSLSMFLYDLAKSGKTDTLNSFYKALGSDAQRVANMPSQPIPGDDRYFAQLQKNMSTASNKVAMRYDIDKKVPRDLWG